MSLKKPPTSTEVRNQLLLLSRSQMQYLSDLSGVPFTTLWKIRDGTTTNPGIETVRKFTPHVGKAGRHHV